MTDYRIPPRPLLTAWILFATVLAAGLQGQEAETELPEFYEIKFVAVANERMDRVRFPVFNEEGEVTDSEPFSVIHGGRPRVQTYEGPIPLVFYSKEAGQAQGERKLIARYRFDPRKKGWHFLFFNARGERAPYEVSTVVLSPETFNAGDIYVLNRSDRPILFQSTDRSLRGMIDVDESTHLRATNLPGAVLQGRGGSKNPLAARVQRVGIDFAARVEAEGRWELQNLDMLRARDGEVRILVFLPPPIEGGTRLGRVLFKIDLREIEIPDETEEDGSDLDSGGAP
jgi:hypothetical protein